MSRGSLLGTWKVLHRIERNTLYHIPRYKQWWTDHRKGKCKACGLCCSGCQYKMTSGACLVYENRLKYKPRCNTRFPETWLQQKANLGTRNKECGYNWKRKPPREREKIFLGMLIALTLISFTYSQAPIILPSNTTTCGPTTNTENVLLVLGDSVCKAQNNLGKNYLSPITIQLNPFWNICDEHNITVYTECHEGKGLSFLAPRFDNYIAKYKPDKIILQSFWNDMAGSNSLRPESEQVPPIPHTQYLELLDNITNKTRKANATLLLMFGTFKPAGDKASNYSHHIREYVIENNISFLDFSNLNANGETISLDAAHPDQEGHDMIKAFVRNFKWT